MWFIPNGTSLSDVVCKLHPMLAVKKAGGTSLKTVLWVLWCTCTIEMYHTIPTSELQAIEMQFSSSVLLHRKKIDALSPKGIIIFFNFVYILRFQHSISLSYQRLLLPEIRKVLALLSLLSKRFGNVHKMAKLKCKMLLKHMFLSLNCYQETISSMKKYSRIDFAT